MSWLISVPVWGDSYVRTFCDFAAPALVAAARRLGAPVKFLIHTNQPTPIERALAGYPVEIKPMSNKPTYIALQNGHADAVRQAEPGARVVLLNADLVVSGNFLTSCAAHLDAGMRAVVLLGIRTNLGSGAPPIDAAPRALLEWAWAHRHQIIRDLEWPHGGSMLPTNLFWQSGDSIVARGFHLHPAAIVKHEGLDFHSTIDGDLLDRFPRESIKVITDPDDCSMLEMSDPVRRFPVRGQHFVPAMVAASMRTRASAMHRWLFTHRIVVCGSGDAVMTDADPSWRILEALGEPVVPGTVAATPAVRAPERRLGHAPGGPRGRTLG
jgi:hypothetical protein